MRALATAAVGSAVMLLLVARTHADVGLSLSRGRSAYQTNEWIDVSVRRSGPAADPSAQLVVEASAPGANSVRAVFAADRRSSVGGTVVDHIRLNARALRPGDYGLSAEAGGQRVDARFSVRSHLRRSSFRLIDWGSRAAGRELEALGEDGAGFNTLYAAATGDASVLAGLDFLGCCVMSGGHQMDLRSECDWSDPYVVQGGTRRAARAALRFRAQSNAIGVHLYDEPGLTWVPDPRTGRPSPHAVPSQHQAYKAAFGEPPPEAAALPAGSSDIVARWMNWAKWKLGFMDAAWQHAKGAIDAIEPALLSVTQSQYAWSAFTDGYYTNVTRSLPVASGHGGYDDYGLGYFNPVLFLELGRARDLSRPCWYLPTWYGNTPADRYRVEQYLCFITGLQGMAKPPDMQVHKRGAAPAEPAIVETNRAMARLGTIFAESRPTRPPVALLYSLSNVLQAQVRDPSVCYAHETRHGQALPIAYLAGQVIQQPVLPVVEEEVLDGTLAAHHRAVVLAGLDHLAEPTVRALERFAAGGGLVLITADCGVAVRGARRLLARAEMPDAAAVARHLAARAYVSLKPYVTIGKYLEAARRLGGAMAAALAGARIEPVCRTRTPGIVARRHRSGDLEYVFLVNATSAPAKADPLGLGSATAAIELPGAPGAVYDALASGTPTDLRRIGGRTSGTLRFGPGALRAFALTPRPIAAVRITAPDVRVGPGDAASPAELRANVSLVDASGVPFSGSAPLDLRLTDPLGRDRYRLYRATSEGVCAVRLPLAVNDPGGAWMLHARDLLSGRTASAKFTYRSPSTFGALAGRTRRAVVFDADRAAIYRFGRSHRTVTIAYGASAWCRAAAERLASGVQPLGLDAQVVDAASLNRPRTLTTEEARTWCGIDYAPSGAIKAGSGNPATLVGYDLRAHCVLIGSPDDNPLIAELDRQGVLPYRPGPVMPGPGRGLIAWEREILAPGVESICAIAADAIGMDEAIGSLYEALRGLEMPDRLEPPIAAAVVAGIRPAAARR